MKRKLPRAGVFDSNSTIVVDREEWEQFLAAVNDLVDFHIRLLKRAREFRKERGTVKQRLRGRARSPRRQGAKGTISEAKQAVVQMEEKEDESWASSICLNCGRDLLKGDRYCDNCGYQVIFELLS